MAGLLITSGKLWFSKTTRNTWSAAGMVGAGEGDGLGVGKGVGVGPGEAEVWPPPPHPAIPISISSRQKANPKPTRRSVLEGIFSAQLTGVYEKLDAKARGSRAALVAGQSPAKLFSQMVEPTELPFNVSSRTPNPELVGDTLKRALVDTANETELTRNSGFAFAETSPIEGVV